MSAGPSAGGIWDAGLTPHTGGFGVDGPDVTWQLNETGLLKEDPAGSGWRLMVPVAVPPGTTAVAGVSGETVRLNCPYARDTDAAENTDSNEAKMIVRTNRLEFTMSG